MNTLLTVICVLLEIAIVAMFAYFAWEVFKEGIALVLQLFIKVKPGDFVWIKISNDPSDLKHRWFVKEVNGNTLLLMENAGAYSGRWVRRSQVSVRPPYYQV